MWRLVLACALLALPLAAQDPSGQSPPEAAARGTLKDAELEYLRTNGQGYEEYRHRKTEMELIYVPPGEFQMGSTDGESDEKPVHRVVLDGYLIGKHEVTNKQYLAFCKAKGRTDPSAGSWGKANDPLPVVNVSWEDAKAYCDWAGLALPTEAQWEHAARGKEGRTYPWGNEAPDGTRCNSDGADSIKYENRSAVGSFPSGASPVGALDMSGNVWEWGADWYDDKYYASCGDGMRNPTGPAGGRSRVLRGGSWIFHGLDLRGANRFWFEPGVRRNDFGFRVARSLAR